jgi:hypothetical protein
MKREGTLGAPSLKFRLRGSYSSRRRGWAEGLLAPNSPVWDAVAPLVTSPLRW